MPEQEHVCAGGCGRSVLPHQSACLSCWDLIDPALREAIKARRGPLREALIGQAREWLADNVRDGKLINPPGQTTPHGTFTLARPSEFVPAAAPAARSPRAPITVDLPPGRIAVTHVLTKGPVRPGNAPEPFAWHTFPQPDGTTVVVLSRAAMRNEGQTDRRGTDGRVPA